MDLRFAIADLRFEFQIPIANRKLQIESEKMPTYEYKCDACGIEFERFQSITAPAIKRCPECGKAKVRRLISTGAGLIFKGSGFYITDYRDKSYTDKAKSESGAGVSSDGKAETKSDARSDSKSDSQPAETKAEAKPESKPKSEPKPSKSAKKK
jgi:putative FmdB family regulatory protein